jgi:membrane protease subunit HflC
MRRSPLPLYIAVAVVILLIVAFNSVYTVPQTEQALVLQFGAPIKVLEKPGLKFKLPFVQDVTYIDKRVLGLEGTTEEVITSDQKRLLVDAFARYRIVNPLKFYQSVGSDEVAQERLANSLNASLRQVIGQVPLQALLIPEREQLMTRIQNILGKDASSFGIKIIDVRIKRTDLPEANSEAIYRRMQTARERQAKLYRAQGAAIATQIRADADRQRTVILAEAQKTAQILRGEGDADRAKILAAAADQDPSFYIFYRSLQAYRHALTGDHTTLVLSPNSEFFRYLNGVPQSSPDTTTGKSQKTR